MKKNMIRILALALVLILALGIIPLGALAVTVDVFREYHDTTPTISGNSFVGGEPLDRKTGTTSVTIKASDYDKYLFWGGEVYDREGLVDAKALRELFPGPTPPPLDTPLLLSSSLTFTGGSGDFFPAYLIYVPHQHKLSRWYSDGTTHWKECLVCKQLNPSHDIFFIGQNWCQDGDEDQVCNVCGGHVPYHDITVIDSEGGKITVNRDNASHRMKITADVETNEGYQFVKLHFTKVRPDGSKQEVVRYGSGNSFWTDMPTYPMEVSAEFVKK